MKIVFALTGAPAASRMPEYLARLRNAYEDATFCVVVSQNARMFVSETLLRNLCEIYINADEVQVHPWHITLAEEFDTLVTSPASAGRIGRFAAGLGIDLIDCLALSFASRHCIFPSTNPSMWDAPVVQRNVATLIESGVRVWQESSRCVELSTGMLMDAVSVPSYDKWLRFIEKVSIK
ncbi:MAG: flavoprotein [Actinomycetaceae bacterium]|nr:flavoprotein [Actinomycetaceae bacterium]